MRAWHYTSEEHLPSIIVDGAILRTESNLSMKDDNAGPPVVWLLDTPDLGGAGHGLNGSSTDKTAVRIEVEADDRWTHDWHSWADAQGMDEFWRKILTETGGGKEATDHWLVSFAEIRRDRWVRVENLRTGDTVWERKEAS